MPVQADPRAEGSRLPKDGLVKLAPPDWDLSRVWEGHFGCRGKESEAEVEVLGTVEALWSRGVVA